jgi:hypothetical protein
MYWQPIDYEVLNLQHGIIRSLTFCIGMLSILQFILTIPMSNDCDLFGINRMITIMKNDVYETDVKYNISTPFIYKGLRHPMQSTMLGILWFSNLNFTVGKLLFAGLYTLGIAIGLYQEEKFLNSIPSYQDYKKRVPNRFLFNPFSVMAFDLKDK